MKNIIKIGLFLSIATLYCVGNNQIVYGATSINMESQASIHFDQAYSPPEVDPVIPSGNTSIPVYTGKRILPKTGEKDSMSWPVLGGIMLGLGILLIVKQKKEKEN